ncbi:MAG: hypothetical protein QG625_175 [Cyanobacteriota bacterium erpe_2018_sw_39hr_WHONDRS-SW48-000098_B_bin.30]|jgi:hypothetical protein|nr:hypothetical protein [Candidatus Obscuribacter sp.]MBK9621271.1 hypothetical protein [Candidatus Obscuribacter sp.]MDQ5964021.1 hypothetical protein [Cyanobacteriota bacterium erpe_2018_sw_39hr_WHONDRS-SW48-000098_B_bin.30]
MDTEAGAEKPNQTSSAQSEMDAIADKFLAGGFANQGEVTKKSRNETYKHPMIIDLAIAFGLLFAMGALTISFVRSYIAHSAKTSIMQGNFKAAIQIIKGAPVPDVFGGAGAENSEELLNQALYLDAIEKLDNDRNDPSAPQELAKVSPQSRYYDDAQAELELLKQKKREAPVPIEIH